MNVIRDRFSILIIFCVLCLQFDSGAQVQVSRNNQMNETSPASPRPDKPHDESSSVKAPEFPKRDSNLTVTLNTTKTEIEASKKSTRKRKSEKLLNKQKESNRKDTNTTKTGVNEKKESAKKRKSEKRRYQDKESNLKASSNTTKKDIEEGRKCARKSGGVKLSNQDKKPSGEAVVVTKRKNSEESGAGTRKGKSQELLNPEKPKSTITVQVMRASPTNRKSEEEKESTRRNNETQRNEYKFLKKLEKLDSRKKSEDKSGSPKIWSGPMVRGRKRARNESEESQINNEDGKEIAEQKNNEVDQESRKLLTDNIEKTSPWPKKSYKNNNRQHKRGRTPIFMRQQEEGNNDKEKNDDDEPPELRLLNVYSLREDMIRILGSISNINASVGVIGRTAEYNDIVLCKITEYNKNKKMKKFRTKAEEDNKYTDEEAEKKIVFIVHGLSVMGFNHVPCLYQKEEFIKLLKLYTEHLDKFDIYLIPIANPDGVSEHAPLSNKNKSPQAACSGVALDRNFDVSWNAFHVNSCHQQYPGPSAFSEPESRAVGDILHQFNNRIAAYINVHAGSYSAAVFKGDAVLFPKGFAEFNSDDDKYMDIKGEIDEALRTAGFKVMSVTVDSLYNWYGKVTGTSVDYASSVYGIPYALEFVMQPYEDDELAVSTERTSENVLTEIWKRVIDVVFMNIHRNNQNNEINK